MAKKQGVDRLRLGGVRWYRIMRHKERDRGHWEGQSKAGISVGKWTSISHVGHSLLTHLPDTQTIAGGYLSPGGGSLGTPYPHRVILSSFLGDLRVHSKGRREPIKSKVSPLGQR